MKPGCAETFTFFSHFRLHVIMQILSRQQNMNKGVKPWQRNRQKQTIGRSQD
ncbi:hypothetical protein GCM10028868_36250 [Virgibacillus kimchii]